MVWLIGHLIISVGSLSPLQVCWLPPWPLVFTARLSLPFCTWCPSLCCLCSPWPTWRYVSTSHTSACEIPISKSMRCQLQFQESHVQKQCVGSSSSYTSRACVVSVTCGCIIHQPVVLTHTHLCCVSVGIPSIEASLTLVSFRCGRCFVMCVS